MDHRKKRERGKRDKQEELKMRRRKGSKEGEGGMTQYAHGNKWFFSARQSIHLPKYCLIG